MTSVPFTVNDHKSDDHQQAVNVGDVGSANRTVSPATSCYDRGQDSDGKSPATSSGSATVTCTPSPDPSTYPVNDGGRNDPFVGPADASNGPVVPHQQHSPPAPGIPDPVLLLGSSEMITPAAAAGGHAGGASQLGFVDPPTYVGNTLLYPAGVAAGTSSSAAAFIVPFISTTAARVDGLEKNIMTFPGEPLRSWKRIRTTMLEAFLSGM